MNQLNQIQEQQLLRSFNLFGAITDKTAESFMDFVSQIIHQEDEFFFDTETAIELGIINHVDKEPEPTEDDLAIESLKSMTKQELKSYITKTQEVFETKLSSELKKKKVDIFLVNTFESTINSCKTFMELVDEINDCNEIDDIYALAIYDLISPAMIEGDSDEE